MPELLGFAAQDIALLKAITSTKKDVLSAADSAQPPADPVLYETKKTSTASAYPIYLVTGAVSQ